MTALKCIMHVDDSEADLELFQEAFFKSGCTGIFTTAHNGEQAIAALRAVAAGEPALRPDVVLLDINMPRVNGLEVLAYIKAHPQLHDIPVVMLSGSESPRERQLSFQLGAADHCTKPERYADARALMRHVGELIDACPGEQ